MNDWLPVVTATVGAVAGGTATYLGIRKDRRETRSQVIDEAKETIDLLKEQNELLKAQLDASENREQEALKREARLENRVAELEREYRNLVKTIASFGVCADPENCAVFKNVNKKS